ncbi:MAG: SRPBCC family protein [Acidimicrobiales bacterium]|nr:SRPBCC family protein [Acidimicrobiales bacterium]
MDSETAEIEIDASPSETWAVVGDFGGLIWMPGIDECTVDGDVRTISMMGMEIKEQLKGRDEDARSIAYAIVDGPVPLDSHLATITVHDGADGGSRVTWQVDVEPEGAAMFKDIYQGALGALKDKLEG